MPSFCSCGSLLAATLWQLTAVVPGVAPIPIVGSTLSELRQVGWFMVAAIIGGLVGGLIATTVLIPLHVMTRSFRASICIYGVLCSVLFIGDAPGPWWSRALYAAIAVAGGLFLLVRFGLLALSASAVPLLFLRAIPVTLDSGAWYFGRSLFALLIVAALVVYAFVISLRGRRWLPEIALE